MTRYPDQEEGYSYQCEACGTAIPAFQGVYWFTRERQQGTHTIEVPYCPECGSESIRSARN